MNRFQAIITLFGTLLAVSAFGRETADIIPVRLYFVNRPASGGSPPSPAHQYAVVTVKNIGDLPVGEPAGSSGGGLILPNPITIKIRSFTQSTFLAQVPPGGYANINLNIPARTLKDCKGAFVHIDTTYTVGQYGPGTVFANDATTLVAHEAGSNKCP